MLYFFQQCWLTVFPVILRINRQCMPSFQPFRRFHMPSALDSAAHTHPKPWHFRVCVHRISGVLVVCATLRLCQRGCRKNEIVGWKRVPRTCCHNIKRNTSRERCVQHAHGRPRSARAYFAVGVCGRDDDDDEPNKHFDFTFTAIATC